MDEPVAHADDLRPGNLRVRFSCCRGDTIGRLPHYLHEAGQSQLHHPVAAQLLGACFPQKFDGFTGMAMLSLRLTRSSRLLILHRRRR